MSSLDNIRNKIKEQLDHDASIIYCNFVKKYHNRGGVAERVLVITNPMIFYIDVKNPKINAKTKKIFWHTVNHYSVDQKENIIEIKSDQKIEFKFQTERILKVCALIENILFHVLTRDQLSKLGIHLNNVLNLYFSEAGFISRLLSCLLPLKINNNKKLTQLYDSIVTTVQLRSPILEIPAKNDKIPIPKELLSHLLQSLQLVPFIRCLSFLKIQRSELLKDTKDFFCKSSNIRSVLFTMVSSKHLDEFCQSLIDSTDISLTGIGFRESEFSIANLKKLKELLKEKSFKSLTLGSIKFKDNNNTKEYFNTDFFTDLSLKILYLEKVEIRNSIYENLNSLVSLSLIGCDIEICSFLNDLTRYFENLKVLNLSGNKLDSQLNSYITFPKSLNSISIFSIRCTDANIIIDFLKYIIQYNWNYGLSLGFSLYKPVNKFDWGLVFSELAIISDPILLTELYWGNTGIDENFFKFVMNCKFLSTLNINECMLDSNLLNILSTTIKSLPLLRNLYIKGNKQRQLLGDLFKTLDVIENCTKIRCLDISSHGFKEDDIDRLAEFLINCQLLRYVSFDDTMFNDLDEIIKVVILVKERRKAPLHISWPQCDFSRFPESTSRSKAMYLRELLLILANEDCNSDDYFKRTYSLFNLNFGGFSKNQLFYCNDIDEEFESEPLSSIQEEKYRLNSIINSTADQMSCNHSLQNPSDYSEVEFYSSVSEEESKPEVPVDVQDLKARQRAFSLPNDLKETENDASPTQTLQALSMQSVYKRVRASKESLFPDDKRSKSSYKYSRSITHSSGTNSDLSTLDNLTGDSISSNLYKVYDVSGDRSTYFTAKNNIVIKKSNSLNDIHKYRLNSKRTSPRNHKRDRNYSCIGSQTSKKYSNSSFRVLDESSVQNKGVDAFHEAEVRTVKIGRFNTAEQCNDTFVTISINDTASSVSLDDRDDTRPYKREGSFRFSSIQSPPQDRYKEMPTQNSQSIHNNKQDDLKSCEEMSFSSQNKGSNSGGNKSVVDAANHNRSETNTQLNMALAEKGENDTELYEKQSYTFSFIPTDENAPSWLNPPQFESSDVGKNVDTPNNIRNTYNSCDSLDINHINHSDINRRSSKSSLVLSENEIFDYLQEKKSSNSVQENNCEEETSGYFINLSEKATQSRKVGSSIASKTTESCNSNAAFKERSRKSYEPVRLKVESTEISLFSESSGFRSNNTTPSSRHKTKRKSLSRTYEQPNWSFPFKFSIKVHKSSLMAEYDRKFRMDNILSLLTN